MKTPGTQLLAIGVALIGVGGSLVTAATVRPELGRVFGNRAGVVSEWLLFGGLALVALGLAATALWACGGVTFLARGAVGSVMSRRVTRGHLRCREARSEDLPRLREFARRMLGDGVAAIEQFRERHAKNPEIFRIVEPISDDPAAPAPPIVGYFIVTPLSKRAADLVDRGALNGRTFSPDDILKPRGRPGAVYIAGVAARGMTARAAVLAHLRDRLLEYRKRGARTVYARPVTRDGMALIQKYRFVPVGPETSTPLGRNYKADLAQIE